MKKIIVLVLVALVAAGIYKFSQLQMSNHATHDSTEQYQYQCPMHPQVIQDHPGNCPICGMRLNRVQKDSPVALEAQRKDDVVPASNIPKHAAVKMSAEKIQLIGIRQVTAQMQHLILPLRVTGTVFHNHEIFELLTAYREAIQVEQRVKKPTPELVAQSRAQAWSLRNKLRRLGIDDDVFKKAEESLSDPTSFIPAHLIIAANGAYVDAQLPAADAMRVALGQKARVESPLFPDKKLEGIVKSVDSVVNTATQTLAVRIEVQSGHEYLKPGLFVNVEMDLDLGERLAVPTTAVFNPGKEAYVFIEKSAGVFVPTRVETGLVAGEKIEILAGLQPGEKVVSAANFLLDSESRFQAAQEVHHD